MRYLGLLVMLFLITACNRHESTGYQGYAEGEYVRVASPVGGQLTQLPVERGASVKVGDLLFVLEQDKEQSAQAQAQSDLELSQAQWQRQQQLNKKQLTSTEEFDKAKALYEHNRARLDEINWELKQKTVYAPAEGAVIDTFYRVGEFVPAAHAVVKLLPPQNIKVRFFIPEADLGKIKLGQSVQLQCDGCVKILAAKIVFIAPQAEFTPPIIYSNDNRHKLMFMVEAKTSPEEAMLLHPGQPIQVQLMHES